MIRAAGERFTRGGSPLLRRVAEPTGFFEFAHQPRIQANLPGFFKIEDVMKRDMDLIRKMLLTVESHEHGYFQEKITVDGYADDVIGYHAQLIAEAGLAVAVDTTALGDTSPSWEITRLTWQGHEFLDAARSETVWQAAKTRIGDAIGTVSFAVLTQLLIETAKKQLGLKQ